MTVVVRLETTVDLDVGSDRTVHDVDAGRPSPPVPSDQARPGFAPAPRPAGDWHQVSVSATLRAVLDDGRRLTLLDDRGWGSSGTWDDTTAEEVEDLARTVVGPDEPADGETAEEAAAGYWVHLAALLDRQGVRADAGALRTLPHDVVLTERLRARVVTA